MFYAGVALQPGMLVVWVVRCPVPGCSNNSALCMNDLEPEFTLQQYIQTKVPMMSSGGTCAAD